MDKLPVPKRRDWRAGMQPEYVMVYTCTVCQQVFEVPWYQGDYASEEMIVVIEHEDNHIANGEIPGWDMVAKIVKEGEVNDHRE